MRYNDNDHFGSSHARPDVTLCNTALAAWDAWDVAAALLREMPEMELRWVPLQNVPGMDVG